MSEAAGAAATWRQPDEQPWRTSWGAGRLVELPDAREVVMTQEERSWTEEFQVQGEQVVAKVKELVREGNIRRIIISNSEGKVLLEIPMTLGVVGALLLPTLAALGAVAAVLTECTITVVREENSDTSSSGDE